MSCGGGRDRGRRRVNGRARALVWFVVGALALVLSSRRAAGAVVDSLPAPLLDAVLSFYYGAESAVIQAAGGELMKTSPAGLAALLAHEGVGPGSVRGVRHVPYQDQAGLWTIGYGHLLSGGEWYDEISEAQAVELRLADQAEAEDAVNGAVSVQLSQSMFDALVSLVFNIGAGAFRRSTLLALLNAGDYAGAQAQFSVWNKVTLPSGEKVASAGLVARRALEADLFGAGGVA